MKYISFEGPDGFGKSTTLRDCRDFFAQLNPRYVKEPGTTKQGQRLRKFLTSPESASMDPKTMAYGMAVARNDVITNQVIPDLSHNHLVISDRCILSSYAYQGMQMATQDRDLAKYNAPWAVKYADDQITSINEEATRKFKYIPQVIFLFMTKDLSSIKQRLANRTGKMDRIDKKLATASNALRNLQTGYLKAASYWRKEFGNRSTIVPINATWPRLKRQQAVTHFLTKLYNN